MKVLIINKKIIYLLVTIIILTIAVFVWYYFYNRIDETFKMDIYYKGNVEEKLVAITCNVDWGNEYIKPLLGVFAKNNINVSFFVTGIWAEKNPKILKDIYEAGHLIGNHGYNHIAYDKLNYEKNKEEILKAHNAIKGILNIEPKYFAPPSGAYNDNTLKAAKDLNYDVIMWSIDTIDWREDSTKDKIIDRVINNIHDSAIILIHPTKETVNSMPEIISQLINKGYNIGTINDIIR